MGFSNKAEGAYWGIDVGGSYAKVGCITNECFRIVKTFPTGENCHPEDLLRKISEFILAEDTKPAAVGLGTAGLIDRPAGGVIRFSPNLPLWNSANAGNILRNLLKAPVVVDNDCNAFAVGAINSGLIPSEGLWLFITLGTGIGGTIINRGEIIYGTGYSGEFGHTTVREGGIPCPCGSDGCWERYAGKNALKWYYTRLTGQKISPRDMVLLASSGDIPAREAFREYGRWVGIGLANLANCFSPTGFFIGGGLSAALSLFESSALQQYKRRCKHHWNVSLLKDSPVAGAYGAALMARKQC
ncbi:MAG: ROK family protein [Candidatus Sabulitectum sp.]|nr:ROK family protein [Candidatus Sabulitectum sp.]